MKNILFIILIFSIIACNNSNPKNSIRKYIEPSPYSVMSYQVKDTSYHNYVRSFFKNEPQITIKRDSIFKVSEKFGNLVFKGNNFSYKILNDSLSLFSNQNKLSYKILDLSPNSFSIELKDNKFLNRIDLVKPKDLRRRITTEVKLDY